MGSARRLLAVGLTAVTVLSVVAPSRTQTLARRATTLLAIRTYPGFYSGQPVLVRATIERTADSVSVVDGDRRLPAFVKAGLGETGALDIRGEVWDLGRMTQDDPRLSGHDLRAVLGRDLAGAWPKPGEVVMLNVTATDPAEAVPAPTLRNIALTPARYVDQRVTIKGQFRGRNLFGDLAQAPPGSDGRRQFVIRSVDAAVWVVGKEPKGRGFVFDINSRIDTRRWLEVSGVVKWDRGIVSVVAQDLNETTAQAETKPEEVFVAPSLIAPEVLFSTPTADETDVATETKIRIQFSRDLDLATIKGHVHVAYSMQQARERGEPEPPPVTARIAYNPMARIMEVTFDPPLEHFRIVEVTLGDDIHGTDGVPLKPWSLKFTTGGS